jgi:hypothetical protein
MNETESTLPAKIGGAEITRFNALRHGVLSRYTVLPWEDAAEYRDLVASLVAEHAPHGPTEEHLVEELAGVLWRKRRLRLAEAAAHRHGLKEALSQSRRIAKRAVVHLDAADGSEDVADTEDAVRDMQEDEAMTRQALDLLNSRRKDPYEAATAALREDTQQWWADTLAYDPVELEETRNRSPPTPRDCVAFWRARCCRGSRRARGNWPTGRSSGSRRSVSRSTPTCWSGSAATRSISTESSNGRWPCCCALKTCGGRQPRADPFGKTNGGCLMHAPGRLVSSLRYTRFTTRTEWTGTASELLGTLGEMAGERVANPKTYWRFYRVSNATEKRNGQNCEARWVDGRDQSNSEWKATDRKAPSRGHPRVRALWTPGSKR